MNTLIGHTGFVGSNLKLQFDFQYCYNSSNIQELSKINHDIIFCAAPNAEKWKINLNPEKDLENIKFLIENLKQTKFNEIILFSTIDVYDNLNNLDEDYEPKEQKTNFYGNNRLYLENNIKNFRSWRIIRLPGLFGHGLKKNIIYDILNQNILSRINLKDTYQWYNLEWLKEDIENTNSNKIYNFFTEPTNNKELINNCFPNIQKNLLYEGESNKNYNLKTKYNSTNYIKSKEKVIESLKIFIKKNV